LGVELQGISIEGARHMVFSRELMLTARRAAPKAYTTVDFLNWLARGNVALLSLLKDL